jgi:hypothetical protein
MLRPTPGQPRRTAQIAHAPPAAGDPERPDITGDRRTRPANCSNRALILGSILML